MLVRIFELGSHPDPPDPDIGAPDDDGSRFEFIVTHVCALWRKIGIEAKQLWTSIIFREMTDLELAKVYLQRSGSRTIDIYVDTVSQEDHIKGVTLCRDEFDLVFDLVVPHVARWRSLILKVRDHECKAGARKHLSSCGPAPNLQTLQLYHLEDWQTSQDLYMATVRPPVLIFGGVLPRLRNVFLIGVNLPWETSVFLTNLQELELALHSLGVRPAYGDWRRILATSPNLKRLSLHYSGPQASENWPDETILLAQLDELSLTDLDPDYLCQLFNRLSIPAVKRLRLDLPDQDFTLFINQISRAAAPTFPHLESLHITALKCELDAWCNLLLSVPKLQFLHIDFRCVDPGFSIALVDRFTFSVTGVDCGLGPQLICPRLTALKVTGLSPQVLSNLYKTRAEADCPLLTIFLNERDRKAVLNELDVGCQVCWFRDPEDDGEDDDEDDEYISDEEVEDGE